MAVLVSDRQAPSPPLSDLAIGYLPAEHIETPTERLARLNKHRNIDVCVPISPITKMLTH